MKVTKHINKIIRYFFLSLLLLNIAAVNASVLYSNDFDGNISVDNGVNASGLSNGSILSARTGFGDWSGSYFDNRSMGNPATMSTLTLTGLKAHTSVDINFMLGFLESWDSNNANSNASPDYLNIYIDGAHVAALTTNNALGTAEIYGGGTELYDGAQINYNNFYSDTLVDMSTAGFLNFAHTSSTLTIGIQAGGAGWQGGSDEGWGIDNLVIEYETVPEPFPLVLMGLGLIGIGLTKRNKKYSLS